ncbi:hypothetical protein ACR78Z_06390 [Sphingobacterium thalpophilum]|uniref:Uncharacterized protein n=1 Tax=Sphingobacterium thalpophilum TaxID=259 RepID=A0ABV4HEP8_9SPHI|nr:MULTISPECIES: hypothetical protein [Sphingobacterium]
MKSREILIGKILFNNGTGVISKKHPIIPELPRKTEAEVQSTG